MRHCNSEEWKKKQQEEEKGKECLSGIPCKSGWMENWVFPKSDWVIMLFK